MKVSNYSPTKTGAKKSVIAFACEKCGHIMVVKTAKNVVSFKSLSTIAKELVTDCPACGAKVTVRESQSVFGSVSLHPQAAGELESRLREAQEKAIQKEITGLIEKIKKPEDLPADNARAMKIKSDPAAMKQYLAMVIHLETDSRMLTHRLQDLSLKKTEEFRKAADARIEAQEKARKEDKQNEKHVQALRDEMARLETEFEAKDWTKAVKARKTAAPKPPEYCDLTPPAEPVYPTLKKPGADGVTYPNEPQYPKLKAPGLFNRKKVQEENEQLLARHRAAVEAYRRACEEENQQLLARYHAAMDIYRRECEELQQKKLKNEELKQAYEVKLQKHRESTQLRQEQALAESMQLKEEARAQLDQKLDALRAEMDALRGDSHKAEMQLQVGLFFDQEIDAVKQQLRLVTTELNRAYSLNVLYPTYRDLIAESSFFEYLSSGRCDALEGTHGAYNLYETECRSDVVARVFRTLEEIKQGQIILHRQISQMLETLKELDNALDKALPFIRKIAGDGMADYLEQNRSKGAAAAQTKPENKETAVVRYFRLVATYENKTAQAIADCKKIL